MITNMCAGLRIDKRKKLAPQVSKLIEKAKKDMVNADTNGNEYGRGLADGICRLVYKLEIIQEVLEKNDI